jgi:hypothetical protein
VEARRQITLPQLVRFEHVPVDIDHQMVGHGRSPIA